MTNISTCALSDRGRGYCTLNKHQGDLTHQGDVGYGVAKTDGKFSVYQVEWYTDKDGFRCKRLVAKLRSTHVGPNER